MTCCNLCHTPTAKAVAQLGLEGSPVLDSTDVQSSAPKQSMPEVHGLVGSPAFSANTACIGGTFYKAYSKDVCLIDIICSLHVHEGCNIQRSALQY